LKASLDKELSLINGFLKNNVAKTSKSFSQSQIIFKYDSIFLTRIDSLLKSEINKFDSGQYKFVKNIRCLSKTKSVILDLKDECDVYRRSVRQDSTFINTTVRMLKTSNKTGDFRKQFEQLNQLLESANIRWISIEDKIFEAKEILEQSPCTDNDQIKIIKTIFPCSGKSREDPARSLVNR
jgi:hypothetical protein